MLWPYQRKAFFKLGAIMNKANLVEESLVKDYKHLV
jgi:hypothetical protein